MCRRTFAANGQHLVRDSKVTRDHRQALHSGFDSRQTERFPHGGKHERVDSRVEIEQILVRHEPNEMQPVVHAQFQPAPAPAAQNDRETP